MFHLWTKIQSNDYVISTTEFPIPDYNGDSFETMIYNDVTEEFLDFQERYKTRSQALKGHIKTIKNLDKILCNEENKWL